MKIQNKYRDVLHEQIDLKDLYTTKLPESLQHSFKGLDQQHVQKFVETHLRMKKQLEMD